MGNFFSSSDGHACIRNARTGRVMCTGQTYSDTRYMEEWSDRIFFKESREVKADSKIDFVSEPELLDEASEQDRMKWSETTFKSIADELKQEAGSDDIYSQRKEHDAMGTELARYRLATFLGNHPDANVGNIDQWISKIDLGGRLTQYIRKELESMRQTPSTGAASPKAPSGAPKRSD